MLCSADNGRPQLRSASERIHAHTTASATEAFLLPALGCGTPCVVRRDVNYTDICLGYSRPRRIVTSLLSCALEAYLLTYLLTYKKIHVDVCTDLRGFLQAELETFCESSDAE